MKTTIITVLAASALLAGCGDGTTSTPAAAVPGASTAGTAATGTTSTASTPTGSTATESTTTGSTTGSTPSKTTAGGSTKSSKSTSKSRSKSKVLISRNAKDGVTVNGSVDNPSTIRLKVTPSPAQKTMVEWTLSCNKGRKSKIKQGKYEISKTSTDTLKQPFSKSSACAFVAKVELAKGGKVKASVLG